MPAVPKPVRKARAERLRQAGAAALRRHLDRRVGGVVRAAVESEISARAEDFSPIAIDGGVPGSVVSLAIVARDGDRLRGRPIS
jgi:threonylcarbamoyladenosine tRNA methylthiotransferase MtaB